MSGGRAILAVTWTTTAVAVIVVSLRLFSRAARKALSGDDYTIAVALIVAIFGSIANTYQVHNGAGQHLLDLDPGQVSQYLKWTIIAVFQTTVATCLIKISICLFILRLLGHTHRNMRTFIFALMTVLVLVNLAFIITWLLQCRPLKAAYDPKVEGKCYAKHVSWSINYASGAYNMLTDFICAGLPALVIRNLQMSTRTKYAISVLMGLGVFTATCSIVRLATLSTILHEDAIHDSVVTEIFTILEENLGLTVASIPALRGMAQTAARVIQNLSNSKRPFLGRRSDDTANTGSVDLENDEGSILNRTTRGYYELQEPPPIATKRMDSDIPRQHL